ncbi:unnamed protein product [Arctia plantaginis]|nr:unnamed protein product [Arctia plantaginis]
MGDCWYETYEVPKSKAYRVWQLVSNMYVFIVLLNEILAHCRSDLNEKEKTDLFQFSIAHPLVSLKIVTLYYKKDKFAVVMKRLLEGTRSTFHSIELERASVKQSTRYFLMLIISVYITLVSTFIDGVRAHIKDAIPIRTEVVLYPTPADTGIFVNILRSLIEIHWYHMMAMMLSIDGFVICSLVIVRFKFKALKLYCQEMRTKVLKNVENKSRMDLEKSFKNDFVTVIKMHEDALW